MVHYRHITIFRDRYRYALGPSVAITKKGDWIVAFNMGVMHEVGPYAPRPWIHPPGDPEYRNYLTRSRDQGATWDAPRVFPGYDWHGVENPGLCVLANGGVLASVYQREFYPTETAEQMPELVGAVRKDPHPWVVSHGGTYIHRSEDGGRTWPVAVKVDTHPYISGYSPRGAVELRDGRLLLPLAAANPLHCDYTGKGLVGGPLGNLRDEQGRILPGLSDAFVCISYDGGRSWAETRSIAETPGVRFAEPTMAQLEGGRLICHIRAISKRAWSLYQVTSDDGGLTWSKSWQVPMWGYPAHIVQLPDGRVLSVYGHRRPPFGIRACLSSDDGSTWDVDGELIIRDDLPNTNLGYPTAIVLDDGTVFTAYWGEDAEGVTTIQGSYFKP